MNIKKAIIALAILGTASLLAVSLNDVNTLVKQINSTKNVEAKQELMITLEKSMNTLNEKDYMKAKEIIKKDLKPVK